MLCCVLEVEVSSAPVFSLTWRLGEQSQVTDEEGAGSGFGLSLQWTGGGPVPLSVGDREKRIEGSLPHLPSSPLPWDQGREAANETLCSSDSPNPDSWLTSLRI